MNNEPVAWIWQDDDGEWVKVMRRKGIPFYTHPVKELTDEEIDAVGDKVSNLIDTYAGRREFARAIMKRCGIISGTDK